MACWGDSFPFSHTDLNQEKYIQIGHILRKLVQILELEISEDQTERQLELLDTYFALQPQAHLIQDLHYVMRLLELLPKKFNNQDTKFLEFYEGLLYVCYMPPILLKSSEVLSCERHLIEYFSVLGGLLMDRATEQFKYIILEVLIFILTKNKNLPICCIPLDRLQNAVSQSLLPQICGQLLVYVDDDMYGKLLQMCTLLAKLSDENCYKLIEQQAIDWLLIRLEPTWKERDFITEPPDPDLNSKLICYDESTELLWILLECLERASEKFRSTLSRTDLYALWNVRYALKYFCVKPGKQIERNNILAILLKLVNLIPRGDLTKSDLALDIVILNLAGEEDISSTCWSNIRISPCAQDFIFARLLLMFLPYFSNPEYYGALKKYSRVAKLVTLGLLVELSDENSAIPFFLTWRDSTNKKIIPFLLQIFREENETLQVEHNPDGCILNTKMPIMGQKQKFETFKKDANLKASPAIADFMLSCRPKVYAIIQMLTCVHEDESKSAKEMYKIFNDELSITDKLTMVVAKNFFALKLGEVWEELKQYFEINSIKPITTDNEMLSVVIARARKWGQYLKTSQENILKTEREQEEINENLYYNELREARLAQSLDALQELDYIARCTKHLFRKSKQLQQVQKLNESNTPADDNIVYHTTFMYDINVNPIFDQILHIASKKISDVNGDVKKKKRHHRGNIYQEAHIPPEDLLWGEISNERCFNKYQADRSLPLKNCNLTSK